MLRKYLKNHQIEIADPHLELNRDKSWKALIKVGTPAVGSKADYESVANRIRAFLLRLSLATSDKHWVTPIFDEVSQYFQKPETREVSPSLVLACLADCRKGAEAPILISHNNTQALLGGVKGVKQAMDEGLVQLHLLSTSQDSDYIPLFRGELTGLLDADGSLITRVITLDPERMHPEALVRLFTSETGENIQVIPPAAGDKITAQQAWDRWVLESTNESVDRIIDSFRSGNNPPSKAETPNILSHLREDGKPIADKVFRDSLKFPDFPESNDEACWKAVLEGLRNGNGKSEIIKNALNVKPGRNYTQGMLYYEFLVKNFLK